MFVILVGNIIDGISIVGSFDGSESANDWADINLKHEEWHVVRILDPKDVEVSDGG